MCIRDRQHLLAGGDAEPLEQKGPEAGLAVVEAELLVERDQDVVVDVGRIGILRGPVVGHVPEALDPPRSVADEPLARHRREGCLHPGGAHAGGEAKFLRIEPAPGFDRIGHRGLLRISRAGGYFESKNGATTSRVSWLGTTGTISKVMPSPWQFRIHSCSSRASSHSISWKQRSKLGSIQLPTYFSPSGNLIPASRTRL